MIEFQEEGFRAIRHELSQLIQEHYQEVASAPGKVVLEPAWDRFEALEAAGLLKVLTARDGDALVGYVIHIIAPSLHYRDLIQAHDDAHFLKKTHRKGFAAIKMLKAAEEMLRKYGVGSVSYHTKNREDINRGTVFKRLGYKAHETIYTKFI